MTYMQTCGLTEQGIEKLSQHQAENFMVCSCVLFGNPRRSGWNFRLTVQERRAFQ